MKSKIIYVGDLESNDFKEENLQVDIVCTGDSITGWNNVRSGEVSVPSGPFPTYPQFLQELVNGEDLKVADCGIAGEISRNGLYHIKQNLKLFPNAQYFVIGYGTNDLGEALFLEQTSESIINNLDEMIDMVLQGSRKPILINVPYLGSNLFSELGYEKSKVQRDYHNLRLKEYCQKKQIPLVDICSVLKDEYFADGLHPNEAGARVIAEEIYKFILGGIK